MIAPTAQEYLDYVSHVLRINDQVTLIEDIRLEAKAKGRNEGKTEELVRSITIIAAMRFGTLLPQWSTMIQSVTDVEKLRQIQDALASQCSLDEFLALLGQAQP